MRGYADALNDGAPVDAGKAAERLGLNVSSQQADFLNQIIRAGIGSHTEQTVIKHNGFVSVYDERMTFENIQTVVERVSALLNRRALFSSVFDDDVFFFGLCEHGNTISMHVSGDCEAYGMTNADYKLEEMEKYVSGNAIESLRLQSLSGSDFEMALIKALGFQLEYKP